METGLNGIIYRGKVYLAIEDNAINDHCAPCALHKECERNVGQFPCAWTFTDGHSYYHYSQELTDKINEQ